MCGKGTELKAGLMVLSPRRFSCWFFPDRTLENWFTSLLQFHLWSNGKKEHSSYEECLELAWHSKTGSIEYDQMIVMLLLLNFILPWKWVHLYPKTQLTTSPKCPNSNRVIWISYFGNRAGNHIPKDTVSSSSPWWDALREAGFPWVPLCTKALAAGPASTTECLLF